MARVKDLWLTADSRKTIKHPDRGGNRNAKRWLACWTDPEGNEVTRAFHKKTDATAHARKMEADADRGEYVDPKAGDELFGPLARKYLRLRDIGGTSRVRYESVYRNQVEPVFAHRKIRSPKPSEVLEWRRSPAMTKLSDSTQGIAHMIVAGTFDLAVADGLRRDNPARSPIVPAPPKGDPPHREAWAAKRVWQVHDAHPEPYRAIPICEAGLGGRQGEVLAFAEDDFDFDNGKVHIRRQLARFGNLWVFKLPKEGKERVAPMSRGMAAIIEAQITACPPTPYELPWLDENGQITSEPHVCRLLFRWYSDDRRTNGMHIKAGNYDNRVWIPALTAAGVIAPPAETENGGPRTRGGASGNGTHILRHFFSTTLQDAGVSLAGVMEFMGHSKKGQPVTLGVYGHVTEETFEQARQAIDGTLFKLRPVASGGTVTELRSAQ